jgi:excisionase family DNA binding protein
MDEILTAAQVADLLQLHPRTVYKLVKQGAIPGKKFGGGWRFNRKEIIGLISMTAEPAANAKQTEER